MVDKKCVCPHINIDDFTTEYTTQESNWLHGWHGYELGITYEMTYESLLNTTTTCCEFLIGMWAMMLAWDSAINMAHSIGDISGPHGPPCDLIKYRTSLDPPTSQYPNFKSKVMQACGDNNRDITWDEVLQQQQRLLDRIIELDDWLNWGIGDILYDIGKIIAPKLPIPVIPIPLPVVPPIAA